MKTKATGHRLLKWLPHMLGFVSKIWFYLLGVISFRWLEIATTQLCHIDDTKWTFNLL